MVAEGERGGVVLGYVIIFHTYVKLHFSNYYAFYEGEDLIAEMTLLSCAQKAKLIKMSRIIIIHDCSSVRCYSINFSTFLYPDMLPVYISLCEYNLYENNYI